MFDGHRLSNKDKWAVANSEKKKKKFTIYNRFYSNTHVMILNLLEGLNFSFNINTESPKRTVSVANNNINEYKQLFKINKKQNGSQGTFEYYFIHYQFYILHKLTSFSLSVVN